jgi:3-methylcrotonyl-CoA carboxylase alpha subunit
MRTIAVHSDADARALFVAMADEAHPIGPAAARESYLDIGKIIAAAKASGAACIHPGYGFLSERAEFAAACEKAGLTFVGPTSRSIEAMGSKSESRKLMESLGVPVVPGYHGDDQSLETRVKAGSAVGFTLLVKASAGGGGKGMKVVREPSGLKEAIESAQREALKSFGDARVLLERYIERPRHIEFQILGDSHGNIIHLFERDCSVQRRHQKVVEESPAPNYSDELRQRMAAAAITPRESDTAFIPASFPGVNFKCVLPYAKGTFYNGKEKSSRTAASIARTIISSIGSVNSARSMSLRRALVAGCRGVNRVQQS